MDAITKQGNYISEGCSCPSPSTPDRSGFRSSSSDRPVLLGISAADHQKRKHKFIYCMACHYIHNSSENSHHHHRNNGQRLEGYGLAQERHDQSYLLEKLSD